MDQFEDVKEYIETRFGNTKRNRKVTIVMNRSINNSLVGEAVVEMPTVSRTRADIVQLESAQAMLNREDHRAPRQLGWQVKNQSNRIVSIEPWDEIGVDIIEMDNRELSNSPSDRVMAENDLPWDKWIVAFLAVMAFGFVALLVALYFSFVGFN